MSTPIGTISRTKRKQKPTSQRGFSMMQLLVTLPVTVLVSDSYRRRPASELATARCRCLVSESVLAMGADYYWR